MPERLYCQSLSPRPRLHCVSSITGETITLCSARGSEAEGEAPLLATAGFDQRQQEKTTSHFNSDRNDECKEFMACEVGIAKETRVPHFTFADLEENEQELTTFKTKSRRSRSSIDTAERALRLRGGNPRRLRT